MIANGNYNWRVEHDEQYGEFYKIYLGNGYIRPEQGHFDLIYMPKEELLYVYLGNSEYGMIGLEIPYLKMKIEFDKVSIIIDSILNAYKIKVLPLYSNEEHL